MDFPVRSFSVLFHVGTLNPRDKRELSCEGRGLSVSTQPKAWQRIFRQIKGNTWTLSKPSNKFLDCHAMTEIHRQHIVDWGMAAGLIGITTLYRVSWFDDEMDSELHCDFDTLEEAARECHDDTRPVEVTGIVATDALAIRTGMRHIQPALAFDILCAEYADEVLQLDGAWWDDILDVNRFSAPRGVIAPRQLASWDRSVVAERGPTPDFS